MAFENLDGSFGPYVDLQGEQGEQGVQGQKGEQGIRGQKGDEGDKGDPPAHYWSGTSLSFQNPDGSWGALVPLKGEKGDTGPPGDAPDNVLIREKATLYSTTDSLEGHHRWTKSVWCKYGDEILLNCGAHATDSGEWDIDLRGVQFTTGNYGIDGCIIWVENHGDQTENITFWTRCL